MRLNSFWGVSSIISHNFKSNVARRRWFRPTLTKTQTALHSMREEWILRDSSSRLNRTHQCGILTRSISMLRKLMTSLLCLGFIASCALSQKPTKIISPEPQPIIVVEEVVEQPPILTSEDLRQIECMARNNYFEARGEGRDGMVAVSNVVMNRVDDPRWPDSPCSVIYQRHQFSWVNQGLRVRSSASYTEAEEIAREVYLRIQGDITSGANHFHADYVSPRWARRFIRTIIIGNHLFYRA